MRKMMKYVRVFLILAIVLLFQSNVFAEECGLDGITTGGSGVTNPSEVCQTHLWCCNGKVYNECGNFNSAGCRVITSDEIQAYNNGGPCTCGCEDVDACYKEKATGNYIVGKYADNSTYEKISDDTTKCNKLTIQKVDSNGTEISGATVSITGPNSFNRTESIGNVTLEQLSAGTYTIKETAAPQTYLLDQTEITVTVADDGTISVSDAQNVYERTATVTRNGVLSIKNIAEQIACYKNKTTGVFVWDRLSSNTDYELVTDVNSSDDCDNFCWRNVQADGNHYSEGIKPPTSDEWVKVGKVGDASCQEAPACYKHKTEDSYIWGNYKDIDEYELVPDTNEDDCYEVVEVPFTDFNRSIIFIIVMVSFALIGVGIIVYARFIKKA